MRAFTNLKKFVDLLMEWLCIVLLAIMTVLVTYQVVTRYFFNKPSAVSENTAQYLFVWMVMFGSAYVFGLKEHLDITILKDKFAPFMNLIVEISINITLFVFSAVICVLGGYHVTVLQLGTMDAATGIPMGFIYASIPVFGAVMLFYAVYNTCLSVQEYKTNAVGSKSNATTTM
ncbi:MAG: TRAP transporter small permease [Synergistaceae bacterium]|nr:TRAP transporter small permease [Synergistaceae bacterium]